MPRNVYFGQGVKSEQNLFEDLMIEALKIYGQDVYYLPRSIVTRDMILNEDHESEFNDAYMIEMYIEDIEGFGGEGNLMQKFGLEIRDEATFIVARRTWEKLVGYWNNEISNFRPNEGDLIYLPMSKSFFEISFVEHEQPFYQLKNLPVYKLQCRLFEYNDEDFNTGVDIIDQIEGVKASTITMNITGMSGEFNIGDRLYQITPNSNGEKWISGIVVKQEVINPALRRIQLADLETEGSDVHYFYNTTSDNLSKLVNKLYNPTFSANIIQIFDINSEVDHTFENDAAAQNYDFENQANDIIDFSELNPFGEPGYFATTQPVVVESYYVDSTTIYSDSTTITADRI